MKALTLIGYTEACEMLKLSKATLKRYVSLGAIPSYKINRRRLFDAEELRDWVENRKSTEPRVAFKFRWLTELEKWMAKTQEIFEDPEKIKSLSFREQVALAEKISRFMNRSTKFMLKMREAALNPGASSNSALKQRKHMVKVMFS